MLLPLPVLQVLAEDAHPFTASVRLIEESGPRESAHAPRPYTAHAGAPYAQVAAPSDGCQVAPDHLVRTASLGALFQTYRQMLSISVATALRSLRHTLDVARGYGLVPLKEVEYLWLARGHRRASSASWVAEHDHPTEGMPFWHNELATHAAIAQRSCRARGCAAVAKLCRARLDYRQALAGSGLSRAI